MSVAVKRVWPLVLLPLVALVLVTSSVSASGAEAKPCVRVEDVVLAADGSVVVLVSPLPGGEEPVAYAWLACIGGDAHPVLGSYAVKNVGSYGYFIAKPPAQGCKAVLVELVNVTAGESWSPCCGGCARLVAAAPLERVEARLKAIEASVEKISRGVSNVDRGVMALRDRMDDVLKKLEEVGRVPGQANMSMLLGEIEEIKAGVRSVSGNVTRLSSEVAGLTARVEQLLSEKNRAEVGATNITEGLEQRLTRIESAAAANRLIGFIAVALGAVNLVLLVAVLRKIMESVEEIEA